MQTDLLQRPNAVIRNGGPQLLRGLILPLPPTMNTYWRSRIIKSRKGPTFVSTYVSKDGVKFKERVAEIALQKGMRFLTEKRLMIDAVICMKDRRHSDIDNRIKPLLDALKEAQVFVDDEQFDEVRLRRGPIRKEGMAMISLWEITPDYEQTFTEAWR